MLTVPRRPVTGPSVWHADDLSDASAWTIELNDRQREEIATEAGRALAAGRTVETLTAHDLPLTS
jgi:hypothetical protein